MEPLALEGGDQGPGIVGRRDAQAEAGDELPIEDPGESLDGLPGIEEMVPGQLGNKPPLVCV